MSRLGRLAELDRVVEQRARGLLRIAEPPPWHPGLPLTPLTDALVRSIRALTAVFAVASVVAVALVVLLGTTVLALAVTVVMGAAFAVTFGYLGGPSDRFDQQVADARPAQPEALPAGQPGTRAPVVLGLAFGALVGGLAGLGLAGGNGGLGFLLGMPLGGAVGNSRQLDRVRELQQHDGTVLLTRRGPLGLPRSGLYVVPQTSPTQGGRS